MIRTLAFLLLFALSIHSNYGQINDLSLDEVIAFNDGKLEKAKELVESDTAEARLILSKLKLNHPEFNDTLFQVYSNEKLEFFYNHFSNSELLKELNFTLEIAKERKDTNSIAHYHNELAEIYLNVSDFKQALKSTLTSLALYNSQNNQDKVGELLLKKGAIEYATGDYVNSIETVFHAADKFKESGSKYHLAFSYLQIGITYLYIEQFQKSIANYKLAKSEFLAFNDSLGAAICETNIGLVYLDQEKYDTAISLFHNAMKEIISSNRQITISLVYHNLGISHAGNEQFDSALVFLKQSLQIDKSINYDIGISANFLELAKVMNSLNLKDSSLYYGLQVIDIMENTPDVDIEAEACLVVAKRLFEMDKSEESAKYFHRYIELNDTIQKEEKILDQIAENEGIKLDNYRIQLKDAKQRELIIAKEFESQKRLIFGMGVFGILLLGTLFLLSVINQRNKKLNGKLLENQKVIEDDLMVKKSLLREIHHRVKNNLQVISSMLSIQNQYVADPVLNEIIEESRARINSMALIHESLYKRDEDDITTFSVYVQNLIPQLIKTYHVDENKIHLLMEVDDVKLSIDESVPCGLLINEIITNSIKHAFPGDRKGEIRIEMSEIGNQIKLKIVDNGVGLLDNIVPNNQDTFGFLLIYTLSEQLEAKMKIKKENGLSYTFHWEKKNYEMLE